MLICVTGPECSGKTTLTNYLASALQISSVDEFARDYLSETDGDYAIEDLDAIAQGQLGLVLDSGCPPSPDWMQWLRREPGHVIRDADNVMLDPESGIDESGSGQRDPKPGIRNFSSTGQEGSELETDSDEKVGEEIVESHEPGHEECIVLTDTFLLVILVWSQHRYGKVSDTVQELYSKYQPDIYLLCTPDLPWKHDVLRENEHERDELFEQYLEHIESSGIPYFVVEGLGPERMKRVLSQVQTLIQKNYLSPTKRGA